MFPPHEINTIPLLAILLDATLKGLVLVVLAWGVSRLLGKAPAAGRHAVWTLAVVALLTLPILSVALPQWQLPLLPEWTQYKPSIEEEDSGRAGLPPRAPEEEFNIMRGGLYEKPFPPRDKESIAVLPEGTAVHVLSDVTHDTVGKDSRRAETLSAGRLDWSAWVMVIWLAGGALVLLPLVLGSFGAWRCVRRARPVTDEGWLTLLGQLAESLGLSRPVRLRRSAREDIPAVFGLFRPTILIPAGADDWSDQRLRVVLLHELAHVKRRDCLTQLLAQLACVLYWFNPPAWLVARQLRIERERACDDLVLAAGQRPSEYADHLLEMVRTLRSRACPSLAAVAMAKKSNFEHRLLAILDAARPRKALTKATTTAAFIAAVAILLPLAMLHVTTKTVKEPATQLTEKTESSPENNSVAVDFSNAARVELVGVSKFGPRPRKWWRPNGEKIDTPPYPGAKLRFRYQYELLLRRQADADVRWVWDVPGAQRFRSADPPKDKDGNILPDSQSLIFGFDETKIPKTMNLRYGVSTGPWTPAQTVQPSLKKSVKIIRNGFYLSVMPLKSQGKNSEWSFDYKTPEPMAVRILAVTNDGKTVQPTWHTYSNTESFFVGLGAVQSKDKKSSSNGEIRATMSHQSNRNSWKSRYRFPVPPEQIKEFRLETSPVRWAEFENISLQPGAATDAKAAILLPKNKKPITAKTTSQSAGEPAVKKGREVTTPNGKPGAEPKVNRKSIPQPAGATLSFRIAPMNPRFNGSLSEAQVQQYVELLHKGKGTQKGDAKYIWLPMKSGESVSSLITAGPKKDGSTYVLVSNQPKEIMLPGPLGERAWWLSGVFIRKDAFNKPAVDFALNETGAERFEALTAKAIDKPLAIIIDDCVWSTPTVKSKIRNRGMITGKFTVEEVDELVRRLELGMMKEIVAETEKRVRDVAERFLKAVQTNDVPAAQRLAVGAVEGWKAWGSQKPGEATADGFYEIALRVVVGELRKSYAKDMTRLAKIEHTKVNGDFAIVVVSPPVGGEKPLVLTLKRTPRGWRVLDLKRARLKDIKLSQSVQIGEEGYYEASGFYTEKVQSVTTRPATQPAN